MKMTMVAFVVLLLTLPIISGTPAAAFAGPAASESIACRALEAHTDDAMKVTVIVFHQSNEAGRSRLASLLREHSATMVEVRAGDGTWRRARMERLKSCFGRGLLLMPAPAPFAERAEFTLRFPASSEAH